MQHAHEKTRSENPIPQIRDVRPAACSFVPLRDSSMQVPAITKLTFATPCIHDFHAKLLPLPPCEPISVNIPVVSTCKNQLEPLPPLKTEECNPSARVSPMCQGEIATHSSGRTIRSRNPRCTARFSFCTAKRNFFLQSTFAPSCLIIPQSTRPSFPSALRPPR